MKSTEKYEPPPHAWGALITTYTTAGGALMLCRRERRCARGVISHPVTHAQRVRTRQADALDVVEASLHWFPAKNLWRDVLVELDRVGIVMEVAK